MFEFFNQVIYVQVSPDRLTVRDPRSGTTISEVPEIAVTRVPKLKVLGVGTEARTYKSSPPVEITNPFAHPRSMISDFTLGEQTLKAFLAKAKPSAFLSPSPKVIMHLLGEPAGGFTQVEARAFREMALGAGASQVTVWHGPRLTDQELLAGTFPSSGKVLS
jgi:rod shape-determining protein MreB and related proteins